MFQWPRSAACLSPGAIHESSHFSSSPQQPPSSHSRFPLLRTCAGRWRTFETVTRVEIRDAFGLARAWVPLPLEADTDWQKTIGNSWSGNARQRQHRARRQIRHRHALRRMAATNEMNPVVEVTSRFMTRDRAVDFSQPASASISRPPIGSFSPRRPSSSPPTASCARRRSRSRKGAKTDVEKARAIYEWVVDNTFRDPKTRGCGVGDVKSLLESGNPGGKCADLNALYVGLARSVGVPARDVYGVRVAPLRVRLQEPGHRLAQHHQAQHCRAEFFARASAGCRSIRPTCARSCWKSRRAICR